jgi:hypothetical protein
VSDKLPWKARCDCSDCSGADSPLPGTGGAVANFGTDVRAHVDNPPISASEPVAKALTLVTGGLSDEKEKMVCGGGNGDTSIRTTGHGQ